MPRVWTEEQKQKLRDNLARGRATHSANAAERRNAPKVGAVSAPDIQALIDDAVRKALANFAPSAAAPATPASDDRLRQLTEQLALSIGDLTNQNSGQKLVSPEVLSYRRERQRSMFERIDEAKRAVAAGDEKAMPQYRLTAKIIAPLLNGEEVIEPLRRGSDNIVRPVEIDWPLAPNLAMVPINDPAKEIFALFKESIGNQLSTRVSGISGKGGAAEPVFATSSENYAVTNQGHVVTAGSATLMSKSGVEAAEVTDHSRSGAAIRNQEPGRVNNGPPTMQVRVLGTIAAPAVQNG